MKKQFLLEAYPLKWNLKQFFEISFVLRIDGQISSAYEFKIENDLSQVDYDPQILLDFGYSKDDLLNYKTNISEVMKTLDKLFRKYLNPSNHQDKFLLYGWNGEFSYNCLDRILRSYGYNTDKYFFHAYCNINSLIINHLIDKLSVYQDLSLEGLTKGLFGEKLHRGTISKIITDLKMMMLMDEQNGVLSRS